jgi:hypothetical protein
MFELLSVSQIEGLTGYLLKGLPSLAKAYKGWPTPRKNILKVVFILIVTIVVVLIAVAAQRSRYVLFVLFLLLGIFWGVVLSYPVMKFFGLKIQAAVSGFLGGVSVSNVGSREASIKSGIRTVSQSIGDLIVALQQQSQPTRPWSDIDTAIVYCVWMTIVATFLIVMANACSSSSPIPVVVPPVDPH